MGTGQAAASIGSIVAPCRRRCPRSCCLGCWRWKPATVGRPSATPPSPCPLHSVPWMKCQVWAVVKNAHVHTLATPFSGSICSSKLAALLKRGSRVNSSPSITANQFRLQMLALQVQQIQGHPAQSRHQLHWQVTPWVSRRRRRVMQLNVKAQ